MQTLPDSCGRLMPLSELARKPNFTVRSAQSQVPRRLLTGYQTMLSSLAAAIAEQQISGLPASLRKAHSADAPRLQGQGLDSHQGPLAREDLFPVEEVTEPADELQGALAAARERGRRRVAEILAEDEMLSAESFADLPGISRVTATTNRQNGQVHGLDGAKRVPDSRHGNSFWTAVEPHNSNSASG
ncbi:hypothetical protein RGR602_PC00450 (plasmid) [Rhizobium gallicum bv. gallicum R602sp]|uniref:Uncharacterized protein n=1 Tax=Rhizobium gallicum bv. gallicum R602sp TaxID=1041138 RepID=A0A0B4XCL2_9HYPH|nr:hypothetical protein RGR602_PC00450 [Rhizobium gallicum bv. gallicum R602sp]